jgi:hypothetical protein
MKFARAASACYPGNGDGTFQTQSAFGTGIQASWIATGDFHGDSISDLALPRWGPCFIAICGLGTLLRVVVTEANLRTSTRQVANVRQRTAAYSCRISSIRFVTALRRLHRISKTAAAIWKDCIMLETSPDVTSSSMSLGLLRQPSLLLKASPGASTGQFWKFFFNSQLTHEFESWLSSTDPFGYPTALTIIRRTRPAST